MSRAEYIPSSLYTCSEIALCNMDAAAVANDIINNIPKVSLTCYHMCVYLCGSSAYMSMYHIYVHTYIRK